LNFHFESHSCRLKALSGFAEADSYQPTVICRRTKAQNQQLTVLRGQDKAHSPKRIISLLPASQLKVNFLAQQPPATIPIANIIIKPQFKNNIENSSEEFFI
jgi:hypothetical protein